MLTGESLPVSKTPIPDSELKSMDFEAEEPSSSAHMSKYFLFSGTKIIRARGSKVPPESVITPNSNCALALVVRTGFNTAKGSLIRSMLFPKPNTFKFYQDSFKFIGMLAILSFMGFLASFYNFIKLKLSWHVIVVRALDLITIAVPPALPATMAIGTTFAISRLKKLYIFCTSPPRVNIGGKINMMCFDKTGTLTQEGLDVLGVRFTVSTNSIMEVSEEPLQNGPLRFSKLYTTISSLLATPFIMKKKQEYANASVASISGISVFESRSAGNPNKEADFPYPLIVCAMACCHSIKVVSGELIGDPLDLKMFEFINWNIDEDTKESPIHPSYHIPTILTVRPHWVPSVDSVKANNEFSDEIHTELGVIKSFEFVSTLRRMSVIVHRFKYSSSVKYHGVQNESDDTFDFDIFLKGAPEVMAGICVPDSSNILINIVPSDYISQLREYTHHGYRVLAVAWKKLRSHTVTQACEIPRDQIEKDMHFLGFIIFENKLKAGTTGVIRTLNTALIRQVMCTGDNVLTSISVSKECEIIRSADRVFIPKFERGMSHEEDAQLVWHDVDYPQIRLDPITFQPNAVLPIGDFVLAITGDAFQWMLDFGTDESFHRV
jgi:cation-transporting ATPase 13A3/4/5